MRPIVKGSTDQSVVIRIVDATDGTPETGVAYNTSGIDLWYRREGATKISITEATLSALNDAHSDGGVLHIGDGYYRLDLPDAAVATGANGVAVGGTVTGMVVIGCYVTLVDVNPYDAVRGGMTALPNANAEAAGGLYTRGSGAGQLSQSANGELGVVTLAKTLTTYTDNTPQTGDGYAILNSGTHGNAALKALIDIIDDYVDTEVAAIKAKTDNLPSDPADASVIAAAFASLEAHGDAEWAGGGSGGGGGDRGVTPGTQVYFYFPTTDATGALVAPSSLAVAVFKDGGATPITSGVSIVTTSFRGVTGLVQVLVDTDANPTDFVAGSSYSAQVTAGTADGIPLNGYPVGEFWMDDAVYHADIDFRRDQANTRDEYTAVWFKGGVRITSGITSPQIQVVKRADGTDLVAATSMSAVGSVAHKYDEATNRQTAGEAVVVLVSATIDGATRTWAKPLGRDSS